MKPITSYLRTFDQFLRLNGIGGLRWDSDGILRDLEIVLQVFDNLTILKGSEVCQ